jgi:hypothetical protein
MTTTMTLPQFLKRWIGNFHLQPETREGVDKPLGLAKCYACGHE